MLCYYLGSAGTPPMPIRSCCGLGSSGGEGSPGGMPMRCCDFGTAGTPPMPMRCCGGGLGTCPEGSPPLAPGMALYMGPLCFIP